MGDRGESYERDRVIFSNRVMMIARMTHEGYFVDSAAILNCMKFGVGGAVVECSGLI